MGTHKGHEGVLVAALRTRVSASEGGWALLLGANGSLWNIFQRNGLVTCNELIYPYGANSSLMWRKRG